MCAMHNTSMHAVAPDQQTRIVKYLGTDAIVKGQAFTYRRDWTGTRQADGSTIAAATYSWERDKYVQKPVPSATYEQWFAGVAAQDYEAESSGEREILIIEPGSYVQIATLIATTVGVTRLTALAAASGAIYTAGRFAAAGFPGRGSAVAMQTLATIASATDYSIGVFSSSLDGTASIAISGTTYTLTKTGAFTYVPATANLQGNEYVHIVAGSTAAAGATPITPGRYKITAKTDADNVILDPAGTAPASATCDCNFYCVRGNPMVWARLDDFGRESGLVEWVNTYTDGSGTTAVPSMVGGFSWLFAGITLGNGDAIDTLADGTYPGQRKGYKMFGALGTNDYQLTVTTGMAIDASQASLTAGYNATALGGLEFDGDGDTATLEWSGTHWQLMTCKGPALS